VAVSSESYPDQIRVWSRRHPVLSAGAIIIVFVIWQFPEWLGQVWPLFTNKTLPDWFAERGWIGMGDLFSNDAGAAEATGIRGEIIYYDTKWQRLFGPVQACWIFERGAKGDMETYLNADPITLGPQETYKLAIVIRMSKNGPLFALGKESLSFFSWRNPAFALDTHCRLQVVLKGEVIQRTFYFQLRCGEEGRVDVSHILLPEK
jgi:hypothetical protein